METKQVENYSNILLNFLNKKYKKKVHITLEKLIQDKVHSLEEDEKAKLSIKGNNNRFIRIEEKIEFFKGFISEESLIEKEILNVILYMIENNNYISNIYYDLIHEEVCKNLYGIIQNKTLNNYKTLLKQFRELKGAGNIFLICEKLASVTMISPFDFFFCIVLHQEKLKKLFVKDFPLENNYDTLINRLQNFEEIKNNP